MTESLEKLIRELRCDIKKDNEDALKIVEERITKTINENIDQKFENIQLQIDQIKKNNTEQNARILELEKQIRYRNIIFFGVEEGEKSYEELENKMLSIITTNMKVICNKSEIELAKRIGKRLENKVRPIVVTLTTYGKKVSILRNKSYLKSLNIYLKEDYPHQVLEKRKELQSQLKQARSEGKTAYLRQDRLVVYEAKKPQNSEGNTGSQNSRKRELDSSPPSHSHDLQLRKSLPATTYQLAKKNKFKSQNCTKGQSSLNEFLQRTRDGAQKPSTSAAAVTGDNED